MTALLIYGIPSFLKVICMRSRLCVTVTVVLAVCILSAGCTTMVTSLFAPGERADYPSIDDIGTAEGTTAWKAAASDAEGVIRLRTRPGQNLTFRPCQR